MRSTLAERGLAPARSRGQNFLHSPRTAERLVELVGLEPADAALEIGPGLGQLTRPIARVARRTLALELDRGLVAYLRDQDWVRELGDTLEIRHVDALRSDLDALGHELGPPVVLFGNLPYRIAGRLLAKLLVPQSPYRRLGLMLQRELADRVLAEPGKSAYGPLAVWARLWTRARRVQELGPNEFHPRPRVRSSFVVFDPVTPETPVRDVTLLRRVVRTAFGQRRKTLRAALRGRVAGAEAGLRSAGIDPGRRGETLTELEFVALAEAIAVDRVEVPVGDRREGA